MFIIKYTSNPMVQKAFMSSSYIKINNLTKLIQGNFHGEQNSKAHIFGSISLKESN